MACSLLSEAPGFKSSDVSPQPVVTTETRKVKRDHGQDRGVGVTERGDNWLQEPGQENGKRQGSLGKDWEVNTEEGMKRVKGNGRIQLI